MKPVFILPLLLALGACATPAAQSGALSSYDGLKVKSGTMRTGVAERQDAAALASVRRVAIEPTRFTDDPQLDWLSGEERTLLSREMDAQLCFELTERYDLVDDPAMADARVKAAITRVAPTGRVGSVAAAAAGFFIPGPIGLRAPGTVGGLSAEAEMLAPDGRQLAALTWNRNAQPLGTDDPSLSRVGDALQFAEPFADTAAATMTAPGVKSRPVPKPDPCAQYGSRLRVEGWATKFATGLYVPEMSGAKSAKDPQAPPVQPSAAQ